MLNIVYTFAKIKTKKMDAVFYGIANVFESLFPLFIRVGGTMNTLFILIGFFANLIWIGYLFKNKADKGIIKSETEYL